MRTLTVFFLTLASTFAADVAAIFQEFDRVSSRAEWPGFHPDTMPVAVFDGHQTWLRRHPSPPTNFRTVEGNPELRVYDGRHPAIQANTAAEIGGVLTATLIADDNARSAFEYAAVLTHECFHVYQRRTHPTWQGNEAILFTYPDDDAAAAGLALLEYEAVRRSLRSQTACWAARVADLRRQRFSRMSPEFPAYERATELNEGLAQYIQDRVSGREPDLSRTFAPGDIRNRAYVTGAAIAFVLDRISPDWKTHAANSLDELLPGDADARCDFTPAERAAAEQESRRAVAAVLQSRKEVDEEFQSAAGWRVIIAATKEHPLMMKGFDPMNVTRISGTKVLHSRYLKLGNEAGTLEMMKGRAVTIGAGPHPLFSGVVTWTILTGLKPDVSVENGIVKIEAPGLSGSFRNASIETEGERIVIRLAPPQNIRAGG